MSSSRRTVWISGLAALAAVAGLALLMILNSGQQPPPPQPGAPDQPATEGQLQPQTPARQSEQDTLLVEGKRLYTRHCANCHGDQGDGQGIAARFLYPRPRNFRENKFRIVSTSNQVPSDQDLLHVIDRGMPGSAMFPFEHLELAERKALVAYVRQLTVQSVEERLRKAAADFGDDVDEQELAETVRRLTTPGDTVVVPVEIAQSDAETIGHGRELYAKQCATCHGKSGRGDGVEKQFDDDGTPTRPRDYTRGIFKGGRESQQLYARTALGMPGTPMPASSNLTPEQIGQIISFIQSLSDPAAQEKVEHKRTAIPAKRVETMLTETIDASLWASAPAVGIVVSPLWWRNYPEPDFQVQAIHDGTTMAIRLSWNDATQNGTSVRAHEFEDMAAVQLFKGEQEPFLGMGTDSGTVDVWLWRAGWQTDLVARADVETTYPNLGVDRYPFEKEAGRKDGKASHDTKNQPAEFLSALAAGNAQAQLGRSSAGGSLQAKGFGTLTMLPKVSQVVRGNGEWAEREWHVVLSRPLKLDSEAGISLASGETVSIAFAIWNGEAKDRNGQKLVSIWHDLELE